MSLSTATCHALADRSPTVLCFQDLHWADPSTATILRRLIDQMRFPVVVRRPLYELMCSISASTEDLERYAIDGADTHFRAAYALLDERNHSEAEDRALAELIVEWALVFYYSCEFDQLHGYLGRHHAVSTRLDDGGSRVDGSPGKAMLPTQI